MQKRKELGLKLVFCYSLLLNSGAAFIWPLVTMYIDNYLHKSLLVSGLSLLCITGSTIVGNYVGGYLFDRWSAYKTAIIGITISTLAVLMLVFFHGWPTFALLLMLVGIGDGINLTLLNSYATRIKSRDARSVFNILYVGLNIGVVIGTAMVGYLLQYGVAKVFMVALLFYLALWILTVTYFNVDFTNADVVEHTTMNDNMTKTPIKSQVHLIYPICVMVFTIYLSYTLWESVMSVHMVKMGIPFEDYSTLWTVNGLMIVCGQPLINYLSRKLKIRLSHQVFLGVFLFASSFAFLPLANSFTTFLMIMIFLTIGEMMGLPDIPAWIDQLSSRQEKGKYQGTFNALMSSGRALSPLFGGMMIEFWGYNPLFICVTLLMMIALVGVIIINYRH
jgi:predicted MFS family arabinose efflux permease